MQPQGCAEASGRVDGRYAPASYPYDLNPGLTRTVLWQASIAARSVGLCGSSVLPSMRKPTPWLDPRLLGSGRLGTPWARTHRASCSSSAGQARSDEDQREVLAPEREPHPPAPRATSSPSAPLLVTTRTAGSFRRLASGCTGWERHWVGRGRAPRDLRRRGARLVRGRRCVIASSCRPCRHPGCSVRRRAMRVRILQGELAQDRGRVGRDLRRGNRSVGLGNSLALRPRTRSNHRRTRLARQPVQPVGGDHPPPHRPAVAVHERQAQDTRASYDRRRALRRIHRKRRKVVSLSSSPPPRPPTRLDRQGRSRGRTPTTPPISEQTTATLRPQTEHPRKTRGPQVFSGDSIAHSIARPNPER